MEYEDRLKRAGIYLAAGVIGLMSIVGCGDARKLSSSDNLFLDTYRSQREEIDRIFGYKSPAKDNGEKIARGREFYRKKVIEKIGPFVP